MKIRRAALSASGTALLLIGWQYAGSSQLLGRTLPAPSEIAAVYAQGFRLALLIRSARATVTEAAIGLACGLSLALLVAIVAHLQPWLRAGMQRLAVLVNAIPIIALAPILILCAGRRSTPAVLAALPVFFLMNMAITKGLLNSPDSRLRAYLRAMGAGPLQQLFSIEIPSAIPEAITGLKTSVGSAMIGAIVGEWFGAPRGLGVVVINAMQNFQIPLMWAAVMMIAAISLLCLLALNAIEEAVTRRMY